MAFPFVTVGACSARPSAARAATRARPTLARHVPDGPISRCARKSGRGSPCLYGRRTPPLFGRARCPHGAQSAPVRYGQVTVVPLIVGTEVSPHRTSHPEPKL